MRTGKFWMPSDRENERTGERENGPRTAAAGEEVQRPVIRLTTNLPPDKLGDSSRRGNAQRRWQPGCSVIPSSDCTASGGPPHTPHPTVSFLPTNPLATPLHQLSPFSVSTRPHFHTLTLSSPSLSRLSSPHHTLTYLLLFLFLFLPTSPTTTPTRSRLLRRLPPPSSTFPFIRPARRLDLT